MNLTIFTTTTATTTVTMCGRFALGVDLNALPYQFNQTALLEGELKQVGGDLYETGRIQGSEDTMYGGRENRERGRERENIELTQEYHHHDNRDRPDRTNISPNSPDLELTNYPNIRDSQTALTPTLSNITQIDISRALGFYPSFNVAPTNTSLIIYMTNDKPNDVTTKYIFEKLKFGMIPEWAKPSEEVRTLPSRESDPSHAFSHTKQIQQLQSKFFNCRRETLAREKSVWTTSRRRQRCVIPVQGYFEWLKTGSNKVPHFVYCSNAPIYYLAGLYAHNVNFQDLTNVNDECLSSFTIVTGPALKTESGDMSWLHSRKPMRILPGTKAWRQWLDPNLEWKDELLEDVLSCEIHNAYLDVEGYPVSKDVGNLRNQGEYLIKREKIDQKSIALFFGGRKSEVGEVKSEVKNEVNSELPEVSKESIKEHSDQGHSIKREPAIVDFQNVHVKKEADSVKIELSPAESESDFKTVHIGSKRPTNSQTPASKRQIPIPIKSLSYRPSKKMPKKEKKQEGIALFFKPVK